MTLFFKLFFLLFPHFHLFRNFLIQTNFWHVDFSVPIILIRPFFVYSCILELSYRKFEASLYLWEAQTKKLLLKSSTKKRISCSKSSRRSLIANTHQSRPARYYLHGSFTQRRKTENGKQGWMLCCGCYYGGNVKVKMQRRKKIEKWKMKIKKMKKEELKFFCKINEGRHHLLPNMNIRNE